MAPPSLKHGCALPDGISATGVMIHKVTTTKTDVALKSNDEVGLFAAGKSIRTETKYVIEGEMLASGALPEEGSGNGISGSPHIDSVEIGDENEGVSKFKIEASEAGAGAGDFGPEGT